MVARKIRDDLWLEYVVTAKHVIDSIANRLVDEVQVRINGATGSRWITTPLADWFFHPDYESSHVDVAASGFHLPDDADHLYYPLDSLTTPEYIQEHQIGPGEEVFMSGLFGYHYGTERAIPIVRVGNIAAMPEEKVNTRLGPMDAYLIESRSLKGLSGSPVFLHLGIIRQVDGQIGFAVKTPVRGGFISLLGIVHGHFRVDGLELDDMGTEDLASNETILNAGIAIVTPVWRMMEVLDQPKIAANEKDLIKKHDEKNLPVMDSLEEQFTKEDFENALKKASRKLKQPN